MKCQLFGSKPIRKLRYVRKMLRFSNVTTFGFLRNIFNTPDGFRILNTRYFITTRPSELLSVHCEATCGSIKTQPPFAKVCAQCRQTSRNADKTPHPISKVSYACMVLHGAMLHLYVMISIWNCPPQPVTRRGPGGARWGHMDHAYLEATSPSGPLASR